MPVFFSDLDGTLLDHHSYSWEAARPGLEAAAAQGCPVILVSSKTRAEMEPLHRAMGLAAHPYISENGGAIHLPDGSAIRLGAPYQELTEALARAAVRSGARLRGFSRMTVDEVAGRTGLPLEIARLAHQREHDEPFVIESGSAEAVARAIRELGYEHTEGGRFHHILRGSDKARAVEILKARYPGERTVGLGDGWNDAGFLAVCGRAWLIPSKHTAALREKLAAARVASQPGPAGWAGAVLEELRG